MERNQIDKPALIEPRLYLFGRTDIYQMNPGKLAAQAAHAATQFVFDVLDTGGIHGTVADDMSAWREQAGGGFGTKITLAMTRDEIIETVAVMQNKFNLQTNIVTDPTYPFSNHYGEYFTAVELTSGYVFADSTTPQEALDYLRRFPLHP
jgi:peptidyl-tRNA hydrolase